MKTIKVIAGIALILFSASVGTALVYWAKNGDAIFLPYVLLIMVGFFTYPISDWYKNLKP